MFKCCINMLCQRKKWEMLVYLDVPPTDGGCLYDSVVEVNGRNYLSPTFCSRRVDAQNRVAKVAYTELKKEHPDIKVVEEVQVAKTMLETYAVVHRLPHSQRYMCKVDFEGRKFIVHFTSTKKRAEGLGLHGSMQSICLSDLTYHWGFIEMEFYIKVAT